MKPRLPLPILALLTATAFGLTSTITDGGDFWSKAASQIAESVSLFLGGNIYTSGASPLLINGDLTVSSAADTPQNLQVNTGSGGVILGSGASASFSGLRDVSFSGTTAGSQKGGTSGGQSTSSWPVTGGIFVGEGATLSISGNSGGVSSCGNSFSSTTASSSSGTGGAAYFVAKNGKLDLSHNAGGVSISDNAITVNAAGTEGYGAIYACEGSTVTMLGNATVALNNNSITNVQRGACGAAIYAQYAPVTISGTAGLVDISNNRATTQARSQTCYSGAIGMAGAGALLSITDNGAVRVSGNSSVAEGASANAQGGAFRLDCGMEMSGNGSVLFENNLAQSAAYQAKGGAITTGYSSTGAVNISRNGSVSFIGNSAVGLNTANQNRYGGAIYADMKLILADNGEVVFRGNSARSGSATANTYNGTGGAIKANMSILISGNDSVIFEKNFEQRGSSVMLRSIYQSSASANLQLQLSAKEGGSIIFRDALYSNLSAATSRAVFNGSYDSTSKTYTQTGSGSIIFSGAGTREDLNAVKTTLGLSAATATEISNSLRSSITSESALLGGSLMVEDNAALLLSQNMSIFGGATLSLSRGGYLEEARELIVLGGGTLSFSESGELAADVVSLAEGTTLRVAGAANVITANSFSMGAGSVVSITLDAAQAGADAALTLLDVDISEPLLSDITLELCGLEQAGSGSYRLLSILGSDIIEDYDTGSFTLRGEGVDARAFRWDTDEQTLFYDYTAPATDIIVDMGSQDITLNSDTTANIIVRDDRFFTLNAALAGNDKVNGDVTIEHGTVQVTEQGSLSGSVIFAGDEDTPRTLLLAAGTELQHIDLQSTAGDNSLAINSGSAAVLSVSGAGALTKTGEGALVLNGPGAAVRGPLRVERGRLRLANGASVSGADILLGSQARSSVSAEIRTDTLTITPLNSSGSISHHSTLASDTVDLGGTAPQAAEFRNVLVELTAATSYTLRDAVLCGSSIFLAESGAGLAVSGVSLDAASSLRAAAGAAVTLTGENVLCVSAQETGNTLYQGLTFRLLLSEQLSGAALAAGSTLTLTADDVLPAQRGYTALLLQGLSAAEDASVLLSGGKTDILALSRTDDGLLLYMETAPEPATAALSLLALSALAARRRRNKTA